MNSDYYIAIFRLTVLLIGIAIFVVYIFYLISLQKVLEAVSPENRTMQPWQVWLLIIPVFSWVWMFFVAKAIAVSLRQEFNKYGVYEVEKPTYDLGLTLAILRCCIIVPFAGLVTIVVWIMYWMHVNQKKQELKNVINNRKLGQEEKSIFWR